MELDLEDQDRHSFEPISGFLANWAFTLWGCELPLCFSVVTAKTRPRLSKNKPVMSSLTEEQREKIKRNRERALEIQRQRKEGQGVSVPDSSSKRRKFGSGDVRASRIEEDQAELEDFEVNASPYVSKKEAMQRYCLPEGTLAVCSFVEKENPHRKGWTPMKLYDRSDIRRRARERFGGLEGLVEERKRRAENRFRKDLEATRDIFKST